MISYIPTYYVLSDLSGRNWSKSDQAREQLVRLSASMALCFRDYLFMATLGESRYARSKIGMGFAGFYGESRDSVYKESLHYGPTPENIQRLYDLLANKAWGTNPGYGGMKWASLAELSGRYGTLSDVLYVDTVVNAQHNGGTAFSKGDAANFMDIDFEGLGNLIEFLNFRRSAKDFLVGFYNILRYVSLPAGKLLIDYRRESGVEVDISKLYPLPDKTYKPVKWQNQPLPELDSVGVRCMRCLKITKDPRICEICGVRYCPDCFDLDKGRCLNCANKNIRCPVCLMSISYDKFITCGCGEKVHAACATHHFRWCDDEHPAIPAYDESDWRECYICHKPLYRGSELDWHGPYTNKRCHKYCYHLDKKSDNNHEDGLSSLIMFEQIAFECAYCHSPILKGHEDYYTVNCKHFDKNEVVMHKSCATIHEANCPDSQDCHCNICQANYQAIKEKYHEQEKAASQ